MATARDERKRSIAHSVDWVDTLLDPGVEIVMRNKPRTRRAAGVGPPGITAGDPRVYRGLPAAHRRTGPLRSPGLNSLFFVRSMWYLHPSEPSAMPGGHVELESECY